MIHYIIILLCFTISCTTLSMKETPKLPKDIIEYIVTFQEADYKQYKCFSDCYSWPYTIAPHIVKAYSTQDPLDKDLTNIKPDEMTLPSVSIWPSGSIDSERKYRLTESCKRTNDAFFTTSHVVKWSRFIFDGINKHGKAFFITHDGDSPEKRLHFIYAITQSSDFGASAEHRDITPIIEGEGQIQSLMLENERNRFIYTIDNNNIFTLYIKDLPKENCPWYTTCIPIAECTTNKLFSKIVSLGNNLYLGLAAQKLYSLWLDKDNKIHYVQRKCLIGKEAEQEECLVEDIAVDNTVVTPKGLHPKIALLTTQGKIYITHLSAHTHIIMYHLANNPSNTLILHRFYYHNGKVRIINRLPQFSMAKNIIEWPDNFEFFYFCSLFKDVYKD